MAYLEIHTQRGVRRVALAEGKVTLGRHSQNHVQLDDERVSRYHCEVRQTEEGYVLCDLGSSNGTRMDAKPVDKVSLCDGDVFTLGAIAVKFIGGSGVSEAVTLSDESESATWMSATATEVARPQAVSGAKDGEEAIELETGDIAAAEEQSPVRVGRSDFSAGTLESLRTVGRDVPFDETTLSLINARGNMVHAAASDRSATAETIRVLRLLLLACIRTNASDVHMEPKQNEGLIRLRVDGGMVQVATVPTDILRRLNSLIKILGEIDIAKKATVQEGHFSAQAPDRRVDYRVSFTPAMFGQKLVLRVLDPVNAPQQLDNLNLPEWMYKAIRNTCRQDTGMLLTCGPTGSGKTTTLYAVLRQIDARQRNVITIEDPIEYELPGATQIPVDAHQGNTFNSLLRSVLRQDPDLIMLGEIRDRETATTAMQAATTGHLVLSTIHAKDTIGTIFRLLDLGVEPYLVASTLNLLLAQRLARKLCPHCKVSKKPTPSQTMRMGRTVEGVSEIFGPGGCKRCFGTGYFGRQGVFELLVATDDVRDVLLNTPNIAAIKKAVQMTMFASLREHGMLLVTKGITSMDEIERVIGVEQVPIHRPAYNLLMAKQRIVSGESAGTQEEAQHLSLRPSHLDEYVGQPRLVEKLRITLEAVKQREEPMEHLLLHGPPGLGKTTLAHIVAHEMQTHLVVTSGPALTRPTDLVGTLTKLQRGDVLFIDEIHRLSPVIEEYLYPAMEDFKIDITVDQGMHARSITLPIKPFCLIGATTRAGLLSGPMRSRFGISHNLEFYNHADLLSILRRSAGLLKLDSSDAVALGEALEAIASRSRGTPRIANRLLRRVRDYAQVKAGGKLGASIVDEALKLEGVDELGLDPLDRKYMSVIGQTYEGGPVGLEAVAATMGEDAGTLEDLVEPFLLQVGFLARTRKGRQLTRAGGAHVGIRIRAEQDGDEKLFD